MKPSPALCARISFTTKEVGKGFYRGTRTGSMGAHTEYGGYVVDWRKVRNFNAPDLTDFKLTPFITNEMQPTKRDKFYKDPVTGEEESYIPKRIDAMEFLTTWKQQNPSEYDQLLQYQAPQLEKKRADEERKRWLAKNDAIYYERQKQRQQQQQQQKPPLSEQDPTNPIGIRLSEQES